MEPWRKGERPLDRGRAGRSARQCVSGVEIEYRSLSDFGVWKLLPLRLFLAPTRMTPPKPGEKYILRFPWPLKTDAIRVKPIAYTGWPSIKIQTVFYKITLKNPFFKNVETDPRWKNVTSIKAKSKVVKENIKGRRNITLERNLNSTLGNGTNVTATLPEPKTPTSEEEAEMKKRCIYVTVVGLPSWRGSRPI